jgi:hypothetical protein
MTVDFTSAGYRASSSDLAISISPLGLVELADEEFEVHGRRLTKYSNHWAFYVGYHWGYRREAGEPQLTFNYTRAFADFINSFCYGHGPDFGSPKATEAVIPRLLERIWEIDNDKASLFWEMGQQGGVGGDIFVKVAYEEPYTDSIGRFHAGRVRILPLNSAFCFPEFHPHDKDRFLRFKLKYKFWGTSLEGTRQVFTYTELITDDAIEEYVNDNFIAGSPRPNPLGTIPVVHIPNIQVSGSPWGRADIEDIIPLNREYNEKATDISDIINYHAAPVTVIVGAKSNQLEKGPKKIWSGLPKEAQVFNLELGSNLQGPMQYMELLKLSMHEMASVHNTALGTEQAISNTSGVALAISFMPETMLRRRKLTPMTRGVKRINELAILTISVKEPMELQWSPEEGEADLQPGQLSILDPADPITYQSTVTWPPPLPTDMLVKLNEQMLQVQMGLQSKRGVLRELGEVFPDEKLAEINRELMEDAKNDGAKALLTALIQRVIMEVTGMDPTGAGPAAEGQPGGPPGAPDANGQVPAGPPPMTGMTSDTMLMLQDIMADSNRDLMAEIVQKATVAKQPQRRNESTNSNNE